MHRDGPLVVSVRQSPHVTGRQLEMMPCPVARGSHVPGYLNESGRGSREERYLKTIERDRQTVSDRFDVCFFSSPAAEKCETSVLRFQG